MEIINEAKEFYKNSWLLIIMDITYNYIHYFLCLLYLIWYPYNIIVNEDLKTFANENYINYYLILYAFYKIHTFVKQKKNIFYDIIITIILLGFFTLDMINKNTIHNIQYWILYNLLICIFIFIYGTFYMIIRSDFDRIIIDKIIIDDRDMFVEYVSDIISDVV